MRERTSLISRSLFGVILAAFIISPAWAEEIVMTFFYPAPGPSGDPDPRFRSIRVGDDSWTGIAPHPAGYAVIQRGVSIGQTPNLSMPLYVQGLPDQNSVTAFMPGPDTDGIASTVSHLDVGIGTGSPDAALHIVDSFVRLSRYSGKRESVAALIQNFSTTTAIAEDRNRNGILKAGLMIRSVGDWSGGRGENTVNAGLVVLPTEESADTNYAAVFLDDVRIADDYSDAGDARLSIQQAGSKVADAYGIHSSNFSTNTATPGITKYGIYVDSSNNAVEASFDGGAGAATRNYGLYIAPVDGADQNYGASIGGSVGIGTQTPISMLHLVQTTPADYPATFDKYNNSGSNLLSMRRARGTAASPDRLLSNDSIGGLSFQGHDRDGFGEGARIGAVAAERWGAGDHPAFLSFYTTPDNRAISLERMRIAPNGNVGIGTTSPTRQLDVSGSARVTQTLTAGAIATPASGTITAGAIQLLPRGRPRSPSVGTIYLDGSDRRFYGYNGTAWRPLDNLDNNS